MFINASRKDPHEEEPVFSHFDNFSHTGLGIFVADRDQFTHGDRHAGREVLHAGERQPVTIPAVVVDPQIPAHVDDVRSRWRKARRLLNRGRTPGSLPTPTGPGHNQLWPSRPHGQANSLAGTAD